MLVATGWLPNQEIQRKSGNFTFNQRKKKDFLRNHGNLGTFEFLIVSFQSGEFLYVQSCIQLSVIVAKC